MKKGLYVLSEAAFAKIYGDAERADVDEMLDIYAPPQTAESVMTNPGLLADAEVIFSGWGAPRMDAGFLEAAKNLEAVFYGAGSVRAMVTDDFWNRKIVLTSAYAANAVPVAEYCVSQILFALKLGWRHALHARLHGEWKRMDSVPGAYGSNVGLISLGMIARKTIELLAPYDINIKVYSTSLDPAGAEDMGVDLCTLENIFRCCDVVSLHTPNLPQTKGMIKGEHFRMMKQDATFINTARGAVVDEPAMVEALKERTDITAVLDVTFPEPPEKGSPLYTMPNVVLTPHIAGSMGNECRRMGRYAVEECRRYLAGEPLVWQITKEIASKLA